MEKNIHIVIVWMLWHVVIGCLLYARRMHVLCSLIMRIVMAIAFVM